MFHIAVVGLLAVIAWTVTAPYRMHRQAIKARRRAERKLLQAKYPPTWFERIVYDKMNLAIASCLALCVFFVMAGTNNH